MKIFYNSWLAKILTFIPNFSTMMFYGFVITERSYLREKDIIHESTHAKQYWDCFKLGVCLSIIILIILYLLNILSWWLLLLVLLPINLFYIIYGIEYLINLIIYGYNDAYYMIGFERQANWIESTWNKPPYEKNVYKSFGWWSKDIKV